MKNLFAFLFVFYSICALGQIKEGHIFYEVAIDNSGKEDQTTAALLETSTFEIYFKKNKCRSDFNMSRMMNIIGIVDGESNISLVLMDGSIAQRAEIKTYNQGSTNSSMKVIKTEKEKIIAGYLCALYQLKDTKGNVSNFWFSDQIEFQMDGLPFFPGFDKGIPLEFESYNNGMKMTMTALEVTDGLDPQLDLFKMVIPDGYTLNDPEGLLDKK